MIYQTNSEKLSEIAKNLMYVNKLTGKVKSKDDYTTIGPGRVEKVKKGDSEANVAAKFFNFMFNKDLLEKKEFKKDFVIEKSYEKERERRHEDLIKALIGKKDKNTSKENGDNLKGVIRGVKNILITATIASLTAYLISKIDIKSIIEDAVKSFLRVIDKIKTTISSISSSIGFTGITPPTDVPAIEAKGGAGSVPVKQVYDYLRSKGVDHVHAMGMLTNIQRESSFVPNVLGDNNTSGGLFQWHDNPAKGLFRFSKMRKAIPDWQTNWKAQVDYAMEDKEGNVGKYFGNPYGSSEEATIGWMKLFENPANQDQEGKIRIGYLKSLEAKTSGSLVEESQPQSTQQNTKPSVATAPPTISTNIKDSSKSRVGVSTHKDVKLKDNNKLTSVKKDVDIKKPQHKDEKKTNLSVTIKSSIKQEKPILKTDNKNKSLVSNKSSTKQENPVLDSKDIDTPSLKLDKKKTVKHTINIAQDNRTIINQKVDKTVVNSSPQTPNHTLKKIGT